jgi:hypothetical protein
MGEIQKQRMRVYHRYLGYFLTGIMAVYSISGMIMIFRNTDFLKVEKVVERQLPPNLSAGELGREIRARDLKIEKEDGDVLTFQNGSYNKATGAVTYTTKELPYFIDRLTHLHKANTESPLFFLNVFFGLSLLFFVVSSFWMFLPGTTVFKKGIYFALSGLVLALILIFI